MCFSQVHGAAARLQEQDDLAVCAGFGSWWGARDHLSNTFFLNVVEVPTRDIEGHSS